MSASPKSPIAALQDEYQSQSRALDSIDREYDQWDTNLTLAERRLDEVEPVLQLFCNPHSPVKDIVDELESTLRELDVAVCDLRDPRVGDRERGEKRTELENQLIFLRGQLEQVVFPSDFAGYFPRPWNRVYKRHLLT
jgi:hypothetical protein